MTLDDRWSAWLDGELEPAASAAVDAELAADPDLAAEVASLAAVRELLRSSGIVQPPAGMVDRLVESVRQIESDAGTPAGTAPVVPLRRSPRRVPLLASVAASLIIIVSVVGGVGGTSTVPAVGELVRRHDVAAAAVADGSAGDMPDPHPQMPGGGEMAPMAMTVDDDVVHAVYASGQGGTISVFRQDGEPDLDALMDDEGGEMADMHGTAMWSVDRGAWHVSVLDGEGYVWTVVSDVDEPMDDLMHGFIDPMMDDLPTRADGFGDRVIDLLDAVVEPFRLGR